MLLIFPHAIPNHMVGNVGSRLKSIHIYLVSSYYNRESQHSAKSGLYMPDLH